MNLNELYRLICNLFRIGTVLEVDHGRYLARVACGGNQTDWIRWSVPRAGAAVTWWAPTVGEQVWIACLCGEMETAFIGGSLYSYNALPPDSKSTSSVILHPDGARIEYDPASSSLTVSGIKTAQITASESITAIVPQVIVKASDSVLVESPQVTVKASQSITLDTPQVTCTNNLTTASLQVQQGGSMSGNIEHRGGSFRSNGVQIDNHIHSGVRTGDQSTGGPR
ncbi:phage baseplate assembly protein V [Serratia microhaemolytica]|uniref:phage baseplate assembly protein V n=1 Tax=Serratia microhaemolytica TaxID=2675110 RepID=UPI000FDD7F3C|nr:phage baseplate assembly protein V [Serratia microhaemolytica]